MGEELMNNVQEDATEEGVLGKVLGAIKRNIVLIILIVALCVCGGVIFAFAKKPTYTATNELQFTATSTATENPSITNNYDLMKLNFKSVIDFCRSEVVADRAEFYYGKFLTEKEAHPKLSVFEYVKATGIYEKVAEKKATDPAYDYETYFKDKVVSSNGYKELYGEDQSHFNDYVDYLLAQDYDVSYGEFRYFMAAKKNTPALTLTEYMGYFATFDGTYYNAGAITGRKYIRSNLVSTSVKNESDAFYFTVSYKDGSSQGARDKLAIIDLAINQESNGGLTEGAHTEEYFNGIKISIIPSTDPSIASDTSKKVIVLVAALLGVVVAAIVVYLRQILDYTVKERSELEEITGRPVLAFIADREEA